MQLWSLCSNKIFVEGWVSLWMTKVNGRCQWCKKLWVEPCHSVKHHCSYLAVTGFIRGDISASHMEVTHRNYCTAAVPKQMYFKNSLTGYGYEVLVPFFFCWVVKIGAGVVLRLVELAGRWDPQSERRCFISFRISLDDFPVWEMEREAE